MGSINACITLGVALIGKKEMIIFTLETVVAHLMSVGYDWIHWSCSFFPKKTSFKCHSFETIFIRFFHAVSELMDSFMKF